MNTAYLVALVAAVTVWSRPIEPAVRQQQQQQQQQQNEEERRREAERLAAERARREEEKRQSEARLEEFRRLRPPTLAERIAAHKRLYPDFVKNIRKFESVRREISVVASQETLDVSAEKAVRKKAKSLQDSTETIFRYVLFEGKAPEPPGTNFRIMTLEDRLHLVGQMSSRVSVKVRQWVDAQKKSIVDVGQTESLLADLQSLKRLLQSMN